jgi:hypothetical protein
MTYEQMKCPKCAGNMVQGFVPDRTYGAILVEGWHEGQPRKSFWTQTKEPPTQGLPIGVFRCEQCGYLEFYADQQFTPQ